MPGATHASVVLARFDELTVPSEIVRSSDEDVLFQNIGSDLRAAGSKASSPAAFKFVLFGLHRSAESAASMVDQYRSFAPWFEGVAEVWGAVLEPFRQFGEANFIDRENPGPQFEVVSEPPPDGTPLVILTSVGWDLSCDLNWDRVKEFSDGVTAVRIAMTGMTGLHSQQTFSFPGNLEIDGLTVTIWKDFAAVRDFAYGPGIHRNLLARQRQEQMGDRTSFTRFKVLSSVGTWHGRDPLVW